MISTPVFFVFIGIIIYLFYLKNQINALQRDKVDTVEFHVEIESVRSDIEELDDAYEEVLDTVEDLEIAVDCIEQSQSISPKDVADELRKGFEAQFPSESEVNQVPKT